MSRKVCGKYAWNDSGQHVAAWDKRLAIKGATHKYSCICKCGDKVTLRQGDKNHAHFAYKADRRSGCKGPLGCKETEVHYNAKWLICDIFSAPPGGRTDLDGTPAARAVVKPQTGGKRDDRGTDARTTSSKETATRRGSAKSSARSRIASVRSWCRSQARRRSMSTLNPEPSVLHPSFNMAQNSKQLHHGSFFLFFIVLIDFWMKSSCLHPYRIGSVTFLFEFSELSFPNECLDNIDINLSCKQRWTSIVDFLKFFKLNSLIHRFNKKIHFYSHSHYFKSSFILETRCWAGVAISTGILNVNVCVKKTISSCL
jgi:hypothetical protein